MTGPEDEQVSRVIGVDVAEQSTNEFREHIAELGVQERASVHRLTKGDGSDLAQFDDASMDIVLCCFTLHHVDGDHRANIVRELRRLCKPNGSLVLVRILIQL